jgi:hypothetical protein
MTPTNDNGYTSRVSPPQTIRPRDPQHRAAATERMRRTRERQREGLRFIGLDVRDTEIAELVRRRLLAEADQDDPDAISTALGALLDQVLPQG